MTEKPLSGENRSEAEVISIRIMDATSAANLILNKLRWDEHNPDELQNALDWINGRIIEDVCKLNDILTTPNREDAA